MNPLRVERARYIESTGDDGGTAAGFRDWIERRSKADPRLFPVDMLRDAAATKIWEEQPKKKPDDLFSIAGIDMPEFLVRRRRRAIGFVDDEEEFEKVSPKFATVEDYHDDAEIKMLKAAESSASAREQYRKYEQILRKAGGNMAARLKDLAD